MRRSLNRRCRSPRDVNRGRVGGRPISRHTRIHLQKGEGWGLVPTRDLHGRCAEKDVQGTEGGDEREGGWGSRVGRRTRTGRSVVESSPDGEQGESCKV